MIVIRDIMGNIRFDDDVYRVSEIVGCEYALPTDAPQWQYNSADGTHRTAERDGTTSEHSFNAAYAAALVTAKTTGALDTAVAAWRTAQAELLGGGA